MTLTPLNEHEYKAITEECGVIDRSALGKLALTGPDAKEFLNGQVTNDIVDLEPGHGCYAAFLTPKGKMLGDLRVLDFGTELHLDCERIALQPLFDRIRHFMLGSNVELHKRTLQSGLISLVGPNAVSVVQRALDTSPKLIVDTKNSPESVIQRTLVSSTKSLVQTSAESITQSRAIDTSLKMDGKEINSGADPDFAKEHNKLPATLEGKEHDNFAATFNAKEHDNFAATIDGRPIRAIRTNVGIDIICHIDDKDPVFNYLTSRGVVQVPEDAYETLRVEVGRPRFGIDLDNSVIPQEAGLNERAVSFTKGCYTGQETVARLYYRGKPNRSLKGLRLSQLAQTGDELRLGEKIVGKLGSVVTSPTFGVIGLALIRREASIGDIVTVQNKSSTDSKQHEIVAEVVELPFRNSLRNSPDVKPTAERAGL